MSENIVSIGYGSVKIDITDIFNDFIERIKNKIIESDVEKIKSTFEFWLENTKNIKTLYDFKRRLAVIVYNSDQQIQLDMIPELVDYLKEQDKQFVRSTDEAAKKSIKDHVTRFGKNYDCLLGYLFDNGFHEHRLTKEQAEKIIDILTKNQILELTEYI